jgi:cytochrome c biogenesis protein CcdA/thiol-disulfide isomerase/thioredoxin
MVLLIIFGFVAGAATAVSPCVVPVLPIALSAGATGGHRRPLGIVAGLTVSFTFAIIALVYVISALGLPNEFLRDVAIGVLLAFGVVLMIPPLSARLEAWLSSFSGRIGAPSLKGDGFWSGTAIGASLGILYVPCAGPILAGVITVTASQSFNAGRLAVALAYGLGSALVLYLLMIGGRRLLKPLARRGAGLQIAMGAVMVVVGLAMLGNYDQRFQSSVTANLPGFLRNPAEGIEKSDSARTALAEINGQSSHGIGAEAASGGAGTGAGRESAPAAGSGGGSGAGAAPVEEEVETKLAASEETVPLEEYGEAPEFADTEDWFNTPGDQPLTLKGLRGRVVLIDFWTYSCINCIRTLPYLEAWDKRYRKDGLTIVGVHTPEFPFEREASNVEEAIKTEGIKYPVVQDNEEGTWDAYDNQYWPAEYFIDAKGNVRYVHFGEGEYGEKEQVIRELLKEAGHAPGKGGADAHGIAAEEGVTTPETYLGTKRHERFTNGDFEAGANDFGAISEAPGESQYTFGGAWNVSEEEATAEQGAELDLNFGARRVYLVLGSPGHPRKMRVMLDGKPISEADAGKDVHGGFVTITDQRLYNLVELPKVEHHVLELRPEAGVQGYAFTFG